MLQRKICLNEESEIFRKGWDMDNVAILISN